MTKYSRSLFLILLASGLFTSPVLKSQDPVIYSVRDNGNGTALQQFVTRYDLVTQTVDSVFNLPPANVAEFEGSGGSAIDPYNKRYFFTTSATESIYIYNINNPQTIIDSLSFPNNMNYVCGSLEYDQFLNSLIWLTMNKLQIYSLDSNSLNTVSFNTIGQPTTCSGQPTAYNFMKQQIFCMPGYGSISDTIHWLLIDVANQQVLLDQTMPDSMGLYCLVYSPVSGKYYGYQTNSLNISSVFEIDPANLSAVKICTLPPGDPGTGNILFDAMFNPTNNHYLIPVENTASDSINLADVDLASSACQTLPFPGFPGLDRNQLLSEPQGANMIYQKGKLLVTTGQSYAWYLNDSLILNTSINNITPTQSGYYKADVVTANGTYASDSVYIDLTGIKEVEAASLKILPNPASDYLIIQPANFSPESISIYDISGSKVSEQNYKPQIDISTLSAGIYFIEIKNEQTSVRDRFVKVK